MAKPPCFATSAATLGWLIVEQLRDGRPTTLGAASGAVAGLVAITPACGFVSALGAIAIGFIAGAVCALAVALKFKFGFDDSLDVVGVHLVGGIAGSLLLGLFATRSVNPAVVHQGLFVNGGDLELLGDQFIAVGATLVWSFALTAVILLALKRLLPGGIRVSDEQEEVGLDLSQHSETGYALDRS